MKKILFLFSVLAFSVALMAGPVNPQKARNVALNFMVQNSPSFTKNSACSLIYTKLGQQSGDTLFYVFKVGAGFVIVSADDAVIPILGYSLNGTFSVDEMPVNCQAWLQDYANAIQQVKSASLTGDAQISQQWADLEMDDVVSQPKNVTTVAPLLTTTWDQSPYYNTLCPGTGNDKTIAGCVAVAMAQIIRYHQYPTQGFGSHSYSDPNYGTQSANFANTTYQYSMMPNALTAYTPSAQVNAVATLIRHCGVAANMEYGVNASSAYDFSARAALTNHFGYETQMVIRSYKTSSPFGFSNEVTIVPDSEWVAILKNSLDEGNPVYYSGSGNAGGHAFVCDGYDANDFFHINWGWGGYCDAYFSVNNLNPSTNNYGSSNTIILLKPNLTGDLMYLFNMVGETTETIDQPILISHNRGQNGDIPAQVSFGNGCQEQLTIYPQNAGDQLLLELLEYQSQTVNVYDGVGSSGNPLTDISFTTPNGTTVMSSNHALTLYHNGNEYVNGFLLRVSPISCLPVAYGLTVTDFDYTSATLSWHVYQGEYYPNHQYNWQIEYGLHGFTPGTGTTVSANDTTFVLVGLAAQTTYDAYLTYTCSNGQISTLDPVTFTTLTAMDCFENPIVEGNGTTDNPVAFAFGFSWNPIHHCSQQIYTAEELSEMGLSAGDVITSLSLQYKSTMWETFSRHIAIYMGHTTKSSFYSTDGWNSNDWVSWSTLSNVYLDKELTFSNIQENDWEKFDFDLPFAWDGTSNIVIAFADSGDLCCNMSLASNSLGGYEKRALFLCQSTPISYNQALPSGYQSSDRANFKLCLQASCIRPKHLTFTAINRHKVKVDWQPGYLETSWNVEYGPAGFAQGNGTMLTVNNTPSVTLDSLASQTYDVYVQANCGDGDLSDWVKISITANNFVQIGDGDLAHEIFPIGHYASNKYTYTQQIFTAEEFASKGLQAGDTLWSIGFQYAGNEQMKSPVKVYLGNTTVGELYNWIPNGSLQLVYEGPVLLTAGWTTINFDYPFTWDGTSNIVVAMLNNSGTDDGSYVAYIHDSHHPRSAERTTTGVIDINNPGYLTESWWRNNMRFGIIPVCEFKRNTEATIVDGESYNFYGTMISEPGYYTHRWYVGQDCDSVVTLHLIVRKILYVTVNGAGAQDGSSWSNAMKLQAAMDTAATITDYSVNIFAKKGTYVGNSTGENSFVIKPNVKLYGGFNGNESANFNLNNRTQANINQTILFGSNNRRVLYQSENFTETTATVIDGFMIRGGTVNNAGEGGGVYLRKYCTLKNCVITANNAAISGSENNVTRAGVAVYNDGGTLINCEIYNNNINLSGTGSNWTVRGVGVYNNNGTVMDCNIHDNLAVYDGNGNDWNVYGGGLYDAQNSSTIQNNSITHNSAARGGGLYLQNGSTVSNCIISNNTSRNNGGGVFVYGNYALFRQCLISNNAAGESGGGVYDKRSTFLSCNIVRNSAVNDGGGIYSSYLSDIKNSVVWGNKVGATDNQLSESYDHHFMVVSSAIQGGYSGAVALAAENTGTGFGYPRFTNPTAEAGVDVNNAVGDWTLQAGSICANMGNNQFATGSTDLNGNPRIQQERIDIGAFESAHGMAFPIHPEAGSNIIYVTTTGAGTQDGSSWSNATSNLQYAMDVAMGETPVASVWVAGGTYTLGKPLFVHPKVAVYGGFAGNEPYTYDLSQRNFTAHPTIVDGDSAYRVLEKNCPFEEESSNNSTQYLGENASLLMPVSGTLDVTACSGTIYDDGGPTGVYSNNCNGTIILRSYNPSSSITLTGTYNTESIDRLRVYDGIGGNLLHTYRNGGTINMTSDTNGILVLTFESDGSVNYYGFEIQFTCSDCSVIEPEESEEIEVPFTTGVSLFDGFTFQNGYVNAIGNDNASCAYLLDNTSMLNCIFKDSHGDPDNSNRAVFASNCTFTNCSFMDNDGLGLYGRTMKMNNCVVSGNTNYGVYATQNSALNGCTIQGNEAGLYLSESSAYGCTVTGNGNETINTDHYAVYATSSSQITNTSIVNNQRSGLYADNSLVINVNVANNTATREGDGWTSVAGGVYAYNNSQFVNCNIVNNKAIAMSYEYNWDTWEYEWVENNDNLYGGLHNVNSNNEFTNCIIWGNIRNGVRDNLSGNASYSYCAIEGGQPGIANITLDSLNNGTASSAFYVRFVNPSAAAGVTTQNNVNYQLSFNSPCVNAGNPNTTSLNLPLYDLAGSLRIKQNHIDIGAYEFGSATTLNINDEICLGESFFYNDYFVYPEQPGLFQDTVIYYQSGVDYIAYINLMVNDVYHVDVDATICEGQSYSFNGQMYNTTGAYTADLQSVAGCDSTVVLHLTVNPTVYYTFYDMACDSYEWNGQIYTSSGDYTQTLTSATGCDSVVTLHLTIHPSSSYAFSQLACDSYTWNGQTYSQSGDYVQTLTNAHGCDSVVTLHLSIVEAITTEWSVTDCDSYTWNTTTYTTSGDYTQTFASSIGCDSIVTLHLTLHNSNTGTEIVTACDTYTWINGVTYTSTPAVAPTMTLTNVDGCDSVVTLHLTINNSNVTSLSVTTCDSYTWNGETYTTSGVYSQTLTNAAGCDSVVLMNLFVYPSAATDDYVTICENELPYSYLDTVFESGTAASTTVVFTLSTVHGCDSVVTLHLTVVPAFTPQLNVAGSINPCVSSSATLSVTGSYAAYAWSNGATTSTITVDEADYYWVEVTDIHGCTGVSETVQLGNSELITDTAKICMVGVVNNHNLVIWEQLDDPDVQNYQIYRENSQADVFEPLALVPASATNAYEDVTADPSVRAYRYKITAVDACGGETPISDYHKTVHLTINQGLGNSWNLIWTPYEGFEFSSYKLYRGTANNNLQLIQTMPATLTSFTDNNPAGDALFYQIEVVMDGSCVQSTRDVTYTGARSNIVYNGTPVTVEVSVDACNSYDWNGQTLTLSGDYTQTFSSDLGYDSVVTLHLTIHPSVTSEFSATDYDSYTWNGVTYTESGDYTQTLQTVYGCDSVVTLHLTLTVGLGDYETVDFKVYPNPTNGEVNVQCTMNNVQLLGTEIHVVDAYGKLVRTVETLRTTSLQRIDISDLAAGVYFVKLVSDDKIIAVRKVVKQ